MTIHYRQLICFETGNMELFSDALVVRSGSGQVAFDGRTSQMFIETENGVIMTLSGDTVTVATDVPAAVLKALRFVSEKVAREIADNE